MNDLKRSFDEKVKSILHDEYGLTATEITKLDSYENINFMAVCHMDDSNTGEITVLVKIFRQDVGCFFDNTDLQHAYMLHLAENGYKCNAPLQTKSGKLYVKRKIDGASLLINVLSYLPGTTVNSLKMDGTEYIKICHLAGEKLGQLHLIAQNLDFKFENPKPKFSSLPENYLQAMNVISSVDDPKIIAQIRKWMKMYEENFLPALEHLRKGFVHGDFSDCNVILMKNDHDWKFGGIIDFEHCHHGYLVGDLGTSIAYFLTKAASIGCNVILAAANLIRGYQSVNPLNEIEKLVLLDAIMGRLCLSYIYGSDLARQHPENRAFIFIQAQHIPKLFDELGLIERDAIIKGLF